MDIKPLGQPTEPTVEEAMDMAGAPPAERIAPLGSTQSIPVRASMRERTVDLAQQMFQQDNADRDFEVELLKWQAENPAYSPGESAEILKRAAATGLPPAEIASNLEALKRPMPANVPWAQIAEGHPVLSKFIGDPEMAPMIMQDVDTLSGLEAWIGRWEYARTAASALSDVEAGAGKGQKERDTATLTLKIAPPIVEALRRGFIGLENSLLNFNRMTGIGPTLEALSPERVGQMIDELARGDEPSDVAVKHYFAAQRAIDDRIKEINSQLHGSRVYKGDLRNLGGAGRAIMLAALDAVEMAPALGAQFGLTLASGGAAAPFGVAAAARAIYGANFGMNFMMSSSNVYNALGNYKDPETGRTLDEANKVLWGMFAGTGAALAVTPATTGIAVKQAQMFGLNILPKALGDANTRALAEFSLLRGVGKALLDTGVHTVQGSLVMANMAAIEAASEELAKSAALGHEADPHVVGEAAYQGFTQALRTLPFLVSHAPTKHLMDRMGRARQAERGARMVEGILQGEKDSKLAQDPQLRKVHEQFVKQAANSAEGNPKEIHYSKEQWDEIATKQGLDPRELHAELLGDDGASYDHAVKSRSNTVTVPVEKIGRLARSEALAEFARNEARLTAGSASVADVARERIKFSKDLEHALANVDPADGDSVRAELEATLTEMYRQIHDPTIAPNKNAVNSLMPKGEQLERYIKANMELMFADVVATRLSMPEGERNATLAEFYKRYYGDTKFLTMRDVVTNTGALSRYYNVAGEAKQGSGGAAGAVIGGTRMPGEVGREAPELAIYRNAGGGVLMHEWMHLQTHLKTQIVVDFQRRGVQADVFKARYDEMLAIMEVTPTDMGRFLDSAQLLPDASWQQRYTNGMEKLSHLWEERLMLRKDLPNATIAAAMETIGMALRERATAKGMPSGTGWAKLRLTQRSDVQEGLLKSMELDARAIEWFDQLVAGEAATTHAAFAFTMLPFQKILDGMDPDEQQRYRDFIKQAQDEARFAVIELSRRARRLASEAWVKELRNTQYEKALDTLRQDAPYQAIEFLRRGLGGWLAQADQGVRDLYAALPFSKINEADALAVWGRDALDIVKRLYPEIFADDGGTVGEVAQSLYSLLGKGTPESLLTALMSRMPAEEMAKRQAEQAIADVAGAAYRPEATDLARAALSGMAASKAAFEKSLMELRWLATQVSPELARRAGIFDHGFLLSSAKDIMLQRSWRNFKPEDFLRTEREYADKAFKAVEQGDWASAYQYKEAQIFNQLFYTESLSLAGKLKLDSARMKAWARNDEFRGLMGKAGSGYRDTIDLIALRLGLVDPARRPPIGLAAIDALVDQILLNRQDGLLVFDPDTLKAVLTRLETANPTVGDVQFLNHVFRNLRELGTKIAEDRSYQAKVRLAEIRAGIMDDLGKMPARATDPLSSTQREGGVTNAAKKALEAFDANLADPELLVEMAGTAAQEHVFNRYLDAKHVEGALRESVLKWFAEHWTEQPKDLKELRAKVIPELDSELPIHPDILTSRSGPRDHGWLWMVALNMGNKQNIQRMVDGYGWSEAKIREVLDRHLTQREWDFIERTWKFMDETLWPEVARHEEAMKGVAPMKVEAVSWDLSNGRRIRGGYFHLAYDPLSKRGVVNNAQLAMGKNQYAPAITPHGYTYGRVEKFTDLPWLDWSVVPSHINQVVHDIAFRGFTIDMSRLLADPTLAQAFRTRLGPTRFAAMLGWIKNVAMNGAEPMAPSEQYLRGTVLSGMREHFATAILGLSFPVIAADIMNPLISATGGQIQFKELGQAWARAMTPDGHAFALSKSRELKFRRDELIQTFERTLNEPGRPALESGFRKGVRDTAFFFMEQIDKVNSTAIWLAKYTELINKGEVESTAIDAADRAVRRSLPTSTMLERSGILRNNTFLGSLVIFYSWFNRTYNMTRELGHHAWLDYINAPAEGKFAAGGRAAVAAGRALAMLMLSGGVGDYLSGRGKEKDETWGEYVARKTLNAPFTALPLVPYATEPLINRAVTGKSKQLSLRTAPALAYAESLLTSLSAGFSDRNMTDERVAGFASAALTLAGLPSAQPKRTGLYLSHVLQGDIRPENLVDFTGGLLYGQNIRGTQPSNPATDLAKVFE